LRQSLLCALCATPSHMPLCEVCGQEGGFLCGRCQLVTYCCEDHQRLAWKKHRRPCKEVAAARALDTAVRARLAEEERQQSFEIRGAEAAPRPSLLGAPASGDFALMAGSCFYINLDRRSDRRAHMDALVSSYPWLMGIKRLTAVDGKQLSWAKLVRERHLKAEAARMGRAAESQAIATIGATADDCSPHLTLGACGCALSHRAAWQELSESSKDWALILEDDIVSLCEHFEDEVVSVLDKLPAEWQFCYLGFHSGDMLPEGQRVGSPERLRRDDGWLAGLWSYLISKPFAQLLMEQAFPLEQQIDTVVGLLAAESGKAYALPPGQFLAYSRTTEDSRDTDVQTFPKVSKKH